MPVSAGERTGSPQPAGTILLVFDGSPAARAGIGTAIRIAVDRGARLEIVGVVRRPIWALFSAAPPVAVPVDFGQALEDTLAAEIRSVLSAVPADVSVRSRVLPRSAVAELLRGIEADGDGGRVLAAPSLLRFVRRTRSMPRWFGAGRRTSRSGSYFAAT